MKDRSSGTVSFFSCFSYSVLFLHFLENTESFLGVAVVSIPDSQIWLVSCRISLVSDRILTVR